MPTFATIYAVADPSNQERKMLIAIFAIAVLTQNGGNSVGVRRTLVEVAEDLKNLADKLLQEVRAIADRDGPEEDPDSPST